MLDQVLMHSKTVLGNKKFMLSMN